MDTSRRTVMTLYRNLLREGGKFQNYNFRNYALRKIKDGFQQNKQETDQVKVKEFLACAKESLALVRRQVIIGSLYSDDPVVVEQK